MPAWRNHRAGGQAAGALRSARRSACILGGLAFRAPTDISAALTTLLADMFARYVKTKNVHWHLSGPHFRDYHLLLDEQADQIFATTDVIAERARKLGGITLHSIGQITRLQRVLDNDADYVTPRDMLADSLLSIKWPKYSCPCVAPPRMK